MAKKTKPARVISSFDELDASGIGAGYTPYAVQEDEQAPPAPESSGLIRRIAGDGILTAVKGAIGVPEAAVGLADMASGGHVGKALENEDGAIGFRPKQAKEYLDQFYSPEQKAAFAAVQNAANKDDPFLTRVGDIAGAAIRNPSTIVHAVGESLPSIGAGGVIGRGVLAGATALSPAIATARAAPLVASVGAQNALSSARIAAAGIGEGVVSAGSTAEQIRQGTKDGLMTGEQSMVAAGSGLLTGGIGMAAGKAAKSLGIGDIDTLLVGGKHVDQALQKGFVRKVLEGVVTEGGMEELPQSVQEQVAQNYALGKPIDEGVDHAAVMGVLTGGAMGAGAQVINHRQPVPEVGPLSRGANQAGDAASTQAAQVNAPAAPITPPPVPLAPEQEQSLLALANTRNQELTDKANGTKDVKTKAEDGTPVTIPGKLKQFLTPAEKEEQAFLAEHGGDVQALAQAYPGVLAAPQVEELPLAPPVEPVAPAAESLQPEPFDTDAAIAQYRAETLAAQQAEAPSVDELFPLPAAPKVSTLTPSPAAPSEPVDIKHPTTGKPFTTMPGALKAQKLAGDGHEVVKVDGGFVVRAKDTNGPSVQAAGLDQPTASGSSDQPGGSGVTPVVEPANERTGELQSNPGLDTSSGQTAPVSPASTGTDSVAPGDWIKPVVGSDKRPRQVDSVGKDGWVYTKSGDSFKPGQFEPTSKPVPTPITGGTGREQGDIPSGNSSTAQLPPTDIRIGDTVRKDGKDYTVTQGIDGGIAATRRVSAQNGVTQEKTIFLKGDDAIRAKLEAATGNSSTAADENPEWTRLPHADRLALNTRAGMSKLVADKIARTPWADITPKTREKITAAMAAPVRSSETANAPEATPTKDENTDGINDHIRALRAVAHKGIKQGGPKGDVRLSTDPSLYAQFDDVVAEARKAVAAGTRPVPFQIHNALDIGIGETDRVIAALSKPEIVVDKAEMRPYRKPDGSVGYEAVPIVEDKPAAPAIPKKLTVYRAENSGRGIKTDAIQGGTYYFDNKEAAELWAGDAGNVVEREIETSGASIQDVSEGELIHRGEPVLIRRDPEGSGKILEIVVFDKYKQKTTPAPVDTAQAATESVAKPAQTVESVARAVRQKIAANRRKAREKSRKEYEAKGWKPNSTPESEQADYDTEVNAKLSEYSEKYAAALLGDNPLPLIEMFVNGNFEASEDVFKDITGVKIRGLSAADKKAALYKWAKWTPEQIAKAESDAKERTDRAAEKNKQEDAKTRVMGEWLALSRLQIGEPGQKGMDGQEFVLQAVAKGYDKAHSQKKGIATIYGLTNGKEFTTLKKGAFTDFVKAAIAFGGLDKTLEYVNPPMPQKPAGFVDRSIETGKDAGMIAKAFAPTESETKPTPALAEPAPAATESVAKPDAKAALSEREKAAKAKMFNALGKLATLAGKNTRMNWTQEEEQQLLPIVIELFDGAMELGAVTFQQAVAYVREFISTNLDQETADAIPFDTLQGAYISVAGRHKDKGVTSKKEVVSFESLAELENSGEQADTSIKDQPNEPTTENQPDTSGPSVQDEQPGKLQPDAGTVRRGNAKSNTGNASRGTNKNAPPDFVPAAGGLTREGSWFETAKRNIDLIELAIQIDSEKRPATPAEQAKLAKYVGFGASAIRNELFPVPPAWAKAQEPSRLIWPQYVRNDRFKPLAERIEALPREWQQSILQSSQYAHYTSEGIIRSVWSALQRMGFMGGQVFEPGMGIGSFSMLMPDAIRAESRYTGVEFDAPTALIAKLLSPQQNMLHGDFIKGKYPKNFFDVNVGNPPFAQTKIFGDPEYAKKGFMIHDFFFAKGIDLVRPGGIQVFVTSKGTMDKQTDKARKYLSERADLLGAIRLPSTAFEDNAGTSVVTDVIFLRKRQPGEAPAGESWANTATVETQDGPVVVNEYFAKHPEMVLGQQRISGNTDDQGRRINSNGMGGEKYTVVSYDTTPAELEAKFAKAIEQLPKGAYSEKKGRTEKAKDARVDFDPSVKREGVVYLAKDGTLMRVAEGVGVPLANTTKLNDKDQAWFKSYVGLRDLVQEARFAQLNEKAWEAALAKLNKAYDKFVKEHGHILDYRVMTRKSTDEEGNVVETESRIPKNRRLLREDYDQALVTSLESIAEDGSIVKSPFLKGRTIGKPVSREVKSIGDALAVSLDDTGHFDLADVGKRLKLDEEATIEALGSQIYQTPDGQWQLADEYLAGDVVAKLEEAEAAARINPDLKRNVEALKEAQPEKLGPAQISAKLGASWIPEAHVNEFSKEIGAGQVTFDHRTETWQVDGGNKQTGRMAGAEYGTARRSPSELLEAILNSRSIKITQTIDKKTVPDQAATTAANEMAKKIKDKFKGWVWTDTDRATELVESYNKNFNNLAPRKFDGSHLTLPGVSLRYKLHPHQLRAIWRMIQTGNTYLAHAVGAGKTIEMIAGGMEQKRLGLIKKPIYVVPNHMLEQFSNEFMELYPLANIMVADDENFSPERRKAFIASATLNNPDAIVITHDAFQRIGVKEESVAPIRDEILSDLEIELSETAKGNDTRVRRGQLEQQIEAVKQRFDRIVGAGAKDSTIKFEDMGVDFVFADEAHVFRKLDFHTAQQIKGIDPNGSKRALDMYVKTRILDKRKPGRSMVFASGTPVTNTMGELYTIMRFFGGAELDKAGISTFDAWARQFGEVAPALEPNAAGKYELIERFAKFDNVPELMSRVRQFMDVLTSDNLGALVKRPNIKGGKPNLNIIPTNSDLTDYMKGELARRIDISREWKPSKDEPHNPDPIVAIITDGRFAAIDPRFFGGALKEGDKSIITEMGDKVAASYHATKNDVYLDKEGKEEKIKGSTQIVFYNLGFGEQSQKSRGFNSRAAFTKRLTDGGIPRAEIAWFDDANSDAKKEAVFKAMRNGTIKVLIGSAKKMGTGVNVQKRLAVLHYQDPPWFPADVEQPHGRILRQGNQNEEIAIEWYTTKGTYQSTMWQMVGRKQRFIDQAFTGDKTLRSMDDLGEASLFEQAAAVASGDPRAIQLAGLKQDVERFTRLQAAHASEQINVRSALNSAVWQIESSQKSIKTLEKAFKAIGEKYFAFTGGRVNGRDYTKPGEFGQAIKDEFNKVAADSVMAEPVRDRTIASIGDAIKVTMDAYVGKDDKPDGTFDIYVEFGGSAYQLGNTAAMGADVDAAGLARRIFNKINEVDSDLQKARRNLAANETDAIKLRKKLGAPFEYQQEMAEKYGELKRLEAELEAEGKATPAPAPTAFVVKADGTANGEAPEASTNLAQTGAPEGNTSDVLFSQNLVAPKSSGPKPTLEQIQGFVEKILQVAKNVIPVSVIASPHEIAGVKVPVGTKPTGAVIDGRIYLFADNIGSVGSAYVTLFHEVFHLGLQKVIPAEDYAAMLKQFANSPLVAKYIRLWKDSTEGQQKAKSLPSESYEALANEEALAMVSETLAANDGMGTKNLPGLAKLMLNWLAKVADRIGMPVDFSNWVRDLTRTEAERFVNDMVRAVLGGQKNLTKTQAKYKTEVDGLGGVGTRFSTLGGALTSGMNNVRDVGLPAGYKVADLFQGEGRLSYWHKSVGTMYNLAQRSPPFKRVFDSVQNFLNDVSFYAAEAADLAPSILPKLDKITDIAKSPLSAADTKALSRPVFEGTLTWGRDSTGTVKPMEEIEAALEELPLDERAHMLLQGRHVAPAVLRMWQGLPQDQYEAIINGKFEREFMKPGVVFKPAELREHFGMTDAQVAIYQEFRKATDKSIDNLAISEMLNYAGKDALPVREAVLASGSVQEAGQTLRDYLVSLTEMEPERDEALSATAAKMLDIAAHATDMKDRGYAPLSRFGNYTLEATLPTGERYFSLFETDRERNKMARMLTSQGATGVSAGTMSQESYKLLNGITPETAALFGEMLGLESQGSEAKDLAFQEYIKRGTANRSAMKRLLQRKGIAGFSEDSGRVLAGFIYSNSRRTSSNLHAKETTEAVSAIPKEQGELKDTAVKLHEYVSNPAEEAQAFRGILFAQYLGGSVASAMVNATQPFTVTLPYLTQFGGVKKAAAQMVAAVRDATKDTTGNAALDAALKKAEEDGIVSPQEVHSLQAQAMGRAQLQAGDGTTMGNALAMGNNAISKMSLAWGKVFGLAEQFNRRTTFIAAYRTAIEQGIANPAKFAEKAVMETQFVYNKGNKPRWGRGAIGATLFTFKQYSVNYLEMVHRMATAGEPGSPERAAGRKAAALAIAILFMLAGSEGLPFVEDIEDVLDGALQRMGYNFSSKQSMKAFLVTQLGKDGAEFVTSGISGLPGAPIDVSGRLGMGNLIPGTGLFQKKTDHTRDLMELAGPAGDMIKRTGQATEQLLGGNVVGAAKTIAPTAARNLDKAYDMTKTGMYRDDKGSKIIDTDGFEAVAKAIGFQPRSVKNVQDASREVQRAKAQYTLASGEIRAKMAQAIFMGDDDMKQSARDDVIAWNRNNPDQRMTIDMPTVLRKVREMRKSKEQRIADTAPKALRSQVREQLRGELH